MVFTSAQISERYTSLLHAMSEIAGAYSYQGRLADALQLLALADQCLPFQEVQRADKVRFLLKYAELLVANYFLTNQEEHRMHLMVQRAREEVEESQDEQGTATVLFLTGQTLYYHNLLAGGSDYMQARDYFQQALKRYETINDTEGMAQALFYTGLTYERYDGEEEVAAEYYQQMLQLARKHDHKWLLSEAMRHLSGILMSKDNDVSLHYALESLRLREAIGFKRALPAAHVQVSNICMERGELEQALKHCQQALQLSEEMSLRSYIMGILLTLGEIQQKQNKLDEARASFEQAAVLARELDLAYGMTRAKALLEGLAGK
jgi:tetratricopeptide (TPR) repeat protein